MGHLIERSTAWSASHGAVLEGIPGNVGCDDRPNDRVLVWYAYGNNHARELGREAFLKKIRPVLLKTDESLDSDRA